MITIDKLCYNSKLRYVNAGEKFAFAVLTLIACVMSRSIVIAGIVLLVTGILTVKVGGIPVRRYLHYLAVPLIFLFFSTLAIMLHISGTPLDLFALPVGNFYITSSKASLIHALQLICTALSSVSCLYFLSFNTPMTDILQVLQRLCCPRLLTELMLLIYRYIFVLLEISSAISLSQRSRLGNRNYRTSLQSFSALVSALFIRSMKKSNALYDAMEARCYDGRIQVLTETFPPAKKEIAALCLFEALLFGLILVNTLLFKGRLL